ncbi:unnamed protein product [Owenia fusiformis]|uniref:Uncharacterized protein n=1 Tax=Owenia fusiformis TaxID=6347 RepID=A0A8J1YBV3_OWEFU|nr:unnamed protein product [Owenia fusiformis]
MNTCDYVDTHFHIWDLKKFNYPWPDADVGLIFRNFTPGDLAKEIEDSPIKHAVFVQCLNGSPEEAEWVFKQAEEFPFIKGVVAGLDLVDSENLSGVIERLSVNPLFVGARHILSMEQVDYIAHEDVMKGLTTLEQKGVPFDLLLQPPHLKYIPAIARQLPNLKMVVDHIAKPYIKDGIIAGWKEDMAEIAKFPNIYCKISGMVTEADKENWKKEDFVPYVQHILDIFGPSRCMFGSDWPVCKLAGSDHGRVLELTNSLLGHLSEQEKIMIFRDNAIRFYNLKNVS